MKVGGICQRCQPQLGRLASLKAAPHKALANVANVANPLHVYARTRARMCVLPRWQRWQGWQVIRDSKTYVLPTSRS